MAKNRRKLTQCPNCGYTFEEINNYCPNCGQENHDLNVPVKHLVPEFFEGTMHFDTKVWRTLKYLITKPGLLTEKFNNGKRASYVPPFRLYVFVSLIFFFVLALTSKSSVKLQSANAADSLALASGSARFSKAKGVVNGSEELEALRTELGGSFFTAEFAGKLSKFTSKGEESKQKLLKNVSFMMFLLMPFLRWCCTCITGSRTAITWST